MSLPQSGHDLKCPCNAAMELVVMVECNSLSLEFRGRRLGELDSKSLSVRGWKENMINAVGAASQCKLMERSRTGR
jgi:hypothetical protein